MPTRAAVVILCAVAHTYTSPPSLTLLNFGLELTATCWVTPHDSTNPHTFPAFVPPTDGNITQPAPRTKHPRHGQASAFTLPSAWNLPWSSAGFVAQGALVCFLLSVPCAAVWVQDLLPSLTVTLSTSTSCLCNNHSFTLVPPSKTCLCICWFMCTKHIESVHKM